LEAGIVIAGKPLLYRTAFAFALSDEGNEAAPSKEILKKTS
jgi:hypothetical protein